MSNFFSTQLLPAGGSIDTRSAPGVQDVLQHLGEGFVTVTPSGRIAEANPAAHTILDAPLGSLIGTPLHDAFPSDAQSRFSIACRMAGAPREATTFTAYFTEYDRWLEGCAFPHLDGFAVAYRDVTLRRRAQIALGDSQTRLQLFMSQIPAIVWSTDEQLSVTSMIGSELARVDQMPRALLGSPLSDALRGIDADPDNMITHAEALAGRPGSHFAEFNNRKYEIHVEPLRDDRGAIAGTMGIAIDVSERKSAEERLAFLAHHDALTGVPNRLLLMDRLVQSVAHAKRRDQYTALLFIDIDHFKEVNDTFGHAAGDELLKIFAQRLCAAVRPGDTVARLGGDEFVVALDDVSEANDVAIVAKKIVASIADIFDADGRELSVTCSIGASLYPVDGESPDDLMRCADCAMYKAKEGGRNNIQFFVGAEFPK
ncbi:MAG TPA: sensor domain-containing diguanylate cyclase [Candidatus Eremiobacteraceae bacterium]